MAMCVKQTSLAITLVSRTRSLILVLLVKLRFSTITVMLFGFLPTVSVCNKKTFVLFKIVILFLKTKGLL